jgi:hypothetical protein
MLIDILNVVGIILFVVLLLGAVNLYHTVRSWFRPKDEA